MPEAGLAHDLLIESFVLLLASLLAVMLVVQHRFSPVIGYLAAGLVIGPHGLRLVSAGEGTAFFAELGVAVLMFFIGMEFSVPRLISARTAVFGLGGAQVALTTALVAIVLTASGLDPLPSVVLGGAVAMSSTAIVHKNLIDRAEGATSFGTTATAILIFQDLVALPILALVAAMDARGGAVTVGDAVLQLVVGLALFGGIAVVARGTFGRVLSWAARPPLNEPFLLASMTLIVGAALAAQSLGLSLPLGAFVVGVILGESDFRHQLEDEIRPFRDLLLGIFFVSAGMSIDLSRILGQPLLVLGGAAAIICGKFIVVFAITRASGRDAHNSLRTALILAHCGELGLLIAGQALATGLVPEQVGQPLLGMVALSMLLGPPIVHWSSSIAARIHAPSVGSPDAAGEAAASRASRDLKNYVMLLGCGPVGRLVATALEASKVDYIAIERDIERFRRAQKDGHNVVFGDASRAGILDAAGLDRAAAVVTLIDDRPRLARILESLRRRNSAIPIIVSTRDDANLDALVDAGANFVFPENHAAGLSLAAQALIAIGLPPHDALERIRTVRAALNPELRLLPGQTGSS